jgi:hypothetical protein
MRAFLASLKGDRIGRLAFHGGPVTPTAGLPLKLGPIAAGDRPKGVPGATTKEAVPALPRVFRRRGSGTLEDLRATEQ